MKVFVRTDQLNSDKPVIIAHYGDDTEIASDAHGPDATMLHIPPSALVEAKPPTEFMPGLTADPTLRLGKNWREASGKMSLSKEQKIDALFEAVNLVIANGVDTSRWPNDAKAKFDAIKKGFAKP